MLKYWTFTVRNMFSEIWYYTKKRINRVSETKNEWERREDKEWGRGGDDGKLHFPNSAWTMSTLLEDLSIW